MDYTYNIQIVGNGTKEEILKELKDIIDSIEESNVEVLDGAEWEGLTFKTEIKSI